MQLFLLPDQFQWLSEPLPSASLCHPDTRIIIWNVIKDEERIEIAILAPHDILNNYWIDTKSKVWAPSKFKLKHMKWAWLKRF